MGWTQAHRLLCHRSPCLSPILAYENTLIFTLRTGDIDCLGNILVLVSLGIAHKEHTINATAIDTHPTASVSRIKFLLDVREGSYLLPVCAPVG